MQIIENKALRINDVLLIVYGSPIIGITEITGFTDTIIGETENRYFRKEFSYSVDGVFFTEWEYLTAENLQAIVIPDNTLYINYRYTRIGTDDTGELRWVNIDVLGVYTELSCATYHVIPKSIFKDYFCYNPQHLGIAANLTRKMYSADYLPKYIERNQTDNPPIDDRDFIDFWEAVCQFFSLIIVFSKQFETIENDEKLLRDYLQQYSILFDDTVLLEDLVEIASNMYGEIGNRGTILIAARKGKNGKKVNGELLRLIGIKSTDENIFGLTDNKRIGWNLGNSSPMFRQVSPQVYFNKGYEDSTDFNDLAAIPTFFNTYLSLINDGDRKVLKMRANEPAMEAGIGHNNHSLVSLKNRIVIDPKLDYVISFYVKQPVDLEKVFNLIIIAYDKAENRIELENIQNGLKTSYFFTNKALYRNDIYYKVEAILFNKDKPYLPESESKLNIGFGNHLRLTADTVKIVPVIYVNTQNAGANYSGGDGSVYIHDLKIHPLKTEYSTGFVQSNNMVKAWLKNNNKALNNEVLEDKMRHYLLPYNTFSKVTYL